MKEKILKLRKEGKTYKEICEEVGCSKAAVSYHCGLNQKNKTRDRKREYSKTSKYRINSQIDFFLGRDGSRTYNYTKRSQLNKDMYDKIVNHPYCYLTGKKIDLEDFESYNLDHIVPVSKGGDNSIENMGLALKRVNQGKSDMTKEEFIKMCKDVVEHSTII